MHEIPLIDESKQLKNRLPKCPEAFCLELAQKIEQYTTAGWWALLRTDPHGNLIWNQDLASASEGHGSFLWFQLDGRTRLQLMCYAHR